MSDLLLETQSVPAVPIIPVLESERDDWLSALDEVARGWVEACGFHGKPRSHCLVPDRAGGVATVLAGITDAGDPFGLAHLPAALPAGTYLIESDWPVERLERAALGWALAGYRFTRYKKLEPVEARLLMDSGCDAARVRDHVAAIQLVRDLINTPAEDMMPEHLGAEIASVAEAFDASFEQVVGEDLLAQDYRAVHMVGRASVHPPRVLDLAWGDSQSPQVVLVGKGVCFDSGGLDLKSAQNMRLMKKDMGGAAHAVGLARLLMSQGAPIRLRLLVAAVENAVASNAYRPGDVVRTRNGLSIEIDNTDAEGRVILSDVLAAGAAEAPALMIDFATLTGAARIALGPELPALFCNDDEVALGLQRAADRVADPIWRLPLHRPYDELIDSPIADVVNATSSPLAGAITAALFLERFVPPSVAWAHFDLMAWNTRARPGRPEGGEAMGLRAVYEYLEQRFVACA